MSTVGVPFCGARGAGEHRNSVRAMSSRGMAPPGNKDHSLAPASLHGSTAAAPTKKYPARAVYCGILNLLSQVGSYSETPPWLRPIALFPEDGSP